MSDRKGSKNEGGAKESQYGVSEFKAGFTRFLITTILYAIYCVPRVKERET